MAERARLERDGDLGVLVIDNQPLNLFDAEMVSDILAALDQTGGCRALLVRAEGKYFTGGVDVRVFKGPSESDATQLTADLLAIKAFRTPFRRSRLVAWCRQGRRKPT